MLLSDLHLGKSAAFRAAGLPVPEGHTADDLARLGDLITHYGAREVIIVGDLFHAPAGKSPEVIRLFHVWRKRHGDVAVRLIIGNHDRRALPPPNTYVEVLGQCWPTPPFQLVHDPADATGESLAVAGHIHPTVVLPSAQGRRWRAACFWLTPRCLVLPSFGGFTSGAVISPKPEDRLFVIADAGVREIPSALWSGAKPVERRKR